MKRSGPPKRKTRLRSNAATLRAWEDRTRAKLIAQGKPQPPVSALAHQGSQRRGKALDEAREFVRDRAGGRCEANWPGVCPDGPHRGHHAHHVILVAQGGPDEAWNLLWLCSTVHRWAHEHVTDARARGIIKARADR